MEVRFFAQLAELTGQEKIMVEPVKDTAALMEVLYARYPALADIPFAVAVGTEMIAGTRELRENDTIALLPPFAGG